MDNLTFYHVISRTSLVPSTRERRRVLFCHHMGVGCSGLLTCLYILQDSTGYLRTPCTGYLRTPLNTSGLHAQDTSGLHWIPQDFTGYLRTPLDTSGLHAQDTPGHCMPHKRVAMIHCCSLESDLLMALALVNGFTFFFFF